MIKKIIITIVSLTTILFSAPVGLDLTPKKIENIEQKSIKTMKDYKEFEGVLKEAISFGDYSKAMILGVLYMQDIPLENGKKVKADYSKAKQYLRMAFSNNIPLSAFYLSLIEDSYKALIDLQTAIENPFTNKKLKEFLAIRYSEIILNKLYQNQKVVQKAISLVLPIAYSSDNPTLDFAVGHLLFINGDLKEANKFINSACNNPKADATLLAICLNDPYLDKRDKNGNPIQNNDSYCPYDCNK